MTSYRYSHTEVSEDLKSKIEKHNEVNWSEIMRRAVKNHLTKLELVKSISSRSKLSEKDAKEIAKKHGLIH